MSTLMRSVLTALRLEGRNHAPAALLRTPLAPKPIAAQPPTGAAPRPSRIDPDRPQPKSESQPNEAVPSPVEQKMPAPSNGHAIAVLTLGESGEILFAREACPAVFGWKSSALVGQNVRVLLKRGLDNDVGRMLHRRRTGQNIAGTTALRVVALRRDGTEFPASVTTLTPSPDTTLRDKSGAPPLSWAVAV